MNRFVPVLFLAACASAAFAQTPAPKPATPAKPASSAAKPAAKAAPAASPEPWIKLPPGVPRVAHLPVKMSFALRYEEIKVGTGAGVSPASSAHLKYTGWRASDSIKFDSWDDHKQPGNRADGEAEARSRRKTRDEGAGAHRNSTGHGSRDSRLRLRP